MAAFDRIMRVALGLAGVGACGCGDAGNPGADAFSEVGFTIFARRRGGDCDAALPVHEVIAIERIGFKE